MNHSISPEQILSYQQNGYVVIEDFLTPDELAEWRNTVSEAVEKRAGYKLPGQAKVYGEGDDKDKDYFDNVFDQLINLWMDNAGVRQLMLDERIGRMHTHQYEQLQVSFCDDTMLCLVIE